MPRKGKSTNAPARVDVNASRLYYCDANAPWGGYVNLRITEEERGDFDEWCVAERDSFQGSLDLALVDGLKLGVSYDAENSAYIATFTGAGCHGDKSRYVLSARGATFSEAVALLVYKHQVLMDGDWSSYSPATGKANFG